MATLNKFVIEHFRGIERTEISLSSRVRTPVVTLVGLNESGKTTILEAISRFISRDSVIHRVFGPKAEDGFSLIPIHRKANFTGEIKITGHITLDDEDIIAMSDLAEEHRLTLDTDSIPRNITLTDQYSFQDGDIDVDNTIWDFSLQDNIYVKKENHLNINSTRARRLVKRLIYMESYLNLSLNNFQQFHIFQHFLLICLKEFI